MSERVEKLIAQENAEILRMLHMNEALYVHAYFVLDKDGKRVYDREMMREEFEENMETLIELNKQADKGRRDLENQMLKINEKLERNKDD